MSWAGRRLGIGTRVIFDGEVFEITEWLPGTNSTEVVLTGATSACRISLVALLTGDRVKLLPDNPGPGPDNPHATAAITLLGLSEDEMQQVRRRAEHVRELLTGYRSGSEELALADEPRSQYNPSAPLMTKYAVKAAELGVRCPHGAAVGEVLHRMRRGRPGLGLDEGATAHRSAMD